MKGAGTAKKGEVIKRLDMSIEVLIGLRERV